jgi:hypothetical protein
MRGIFVPFHNPTYGTPQYPPMYGVPSYYPPPPYQHPYPVVAPPPMSGPLPAPMMCLASQPSNMATSESAMPSYEPYRYFPQNNPYFPFLGPPWQLLLHKENHTLGLTLFIPLPLRNFKILNKLIWKIRPISRIMTKIKEKNETIITQDQAEITPNKTNMLGETRTRVTKILKGTIKKNSKGGTTTITSIKISLVPFAVTIVVILTISPKLLTSNT